MQIRNRILQAVGVMLALLLTFEPILSQTKKKKTTLKTPSPPIDTVTSQTSTQRDEFVSVEVEPYPIQNIQNLVEYPEVAKRAGLEGKVLLSALIDTSGKVIKVLIDKSDYPVFEESARNAVMKAKFTPARQNGKHVKLWYTLPIVYKLEKESNKYKVEVPIPLSIEYNRRYDFVSVDVEPQPLQDIQKLVEYPEEAKKASLEGRVVLYALIDSTGKVVTVETDNSGYSILVESARRAMFKVPFTPAIKDGKAIQYWYTMPVLFKLYTIDK